MAVDRVTLSDVHRHSLDEYHQLREAAAFVDELEHVELLDGWLVDMSPKTPQHERAVAWLADWLIRAIERSRYVVGVARPLTLTRARSEPEPDLIVFERGTPAPYHPSTAVLVIEVAVSSLARDLGVKAPLYAAAHVTEYWVLDLEGRRLVVHRAPAENGYEDRFELGAGERLTATALALPELDLDVVLAAADRPE